MRFREYLYSSGILRRYSVNSTVISVGNLTMGGSGKTPLVVYLARLFRQNKYSPAIISRGYGGTAKDRINIVSDGTSLLLDSLSSGDEPRLMAESLPGTPVVTGKKRILPCRFVTEKYGSDILILDDGFQHMQVCRDIDIVLFSAASLYRYMHVFPGGLLREPFTALSRGHCFVITGCTDDLLTNVYKFKEFLHLNWPKAPVFLSSYVPNYLTDSKGTVHPFDTIKGPVIAFCGIALPDRFRKTLDALEIEVVSFHVFRDHADFSENDIESLIGLAHHHEASALVTTEKDLVKLRTANFQLPLYALSMEVSIDKDFEEFILSRLKK